MVRLTQIIIESPEPKKTQKFYADLGFKFNLTIDKKSATRDQNGKKRHGLVLAIFKPSKIAAPPFDGKTAIVINTDNLDGTIARMRKKQPNCFISPIDTDTNGHRTVLLLDPDGQKIFLIEPAAILKPPHLGLKAKVRGKNKKKK